MEKFRQLLFRSLKCVGKCIFVFLKYQLFSFFLVYVATRVVNFINDPYMEEIGEDFVMQDVFSLITQSVVFLILYATMMSLHKVLFKKDYKVQYFLAIISFVLMMLWVFS